MIHIIPIVKKNIYLWMALAGLILSCSSEKDTFTNRLYHNVTAKYNAYYLAKEKISEAELDFIQSYQEDYSQVLPVFPPIDSTVMKSNMDKLEEARELAAMAIDYHRISQWVDDSYFLIGQIDYYEANTEEAINTFKYLNVNSKDDNVRHQALIQLLRIFVDLKSFDDASYVIDFLSKEAEISKVNKQLLFKTLGYYYEARRETDGILASLEKCIELTSDKKEKSRLYFILAQRYQRAGFDAQAYDYYQNALSGNPPYELAFFSQLYAQQVAELEKSKDLKKVREYYDNLYADRKNTDFKDVILYEKALFELKQNETEEAIRLLHQAASETGKLDQQKGYIYQKLAELFFDQKEDFLASKYYVDSALQYFNETNINYNLLLGKKEVLDRYAFQYERITQNDSLLRLSQMSPEEQNKIAEDYLAKEEKRLMAEAAKDSPKKPASIFDNLLAFGGSGQASSFYFDNPVAIQQGQIDFSKNWGSRALTDNWRRKTNSYQVTNTLSKTTPVDSANVKTEPQEVSLGLPTKEELLSQIPTDATQVQQLRDDIEVSNFELGKILYFDLNRPDLAREYLHALIQDFPNTDKKPEAYYTLFLIEQSTGGNTQYYVSKLNQEFPDSPFTKSVNNPIDAAGSLAANKRAAENYDKAYTQYQAGDYEAAISLVNGTLNQYPLSTVSEKLRLLQAMLIGKTDSKAKYQESLEDYIKTTQDPGLSKMARNMLVALTGEKEEVISQADSVSTASDSTSMAPTVPAVASADSVAQEKEQIYKLNMDQTHIFILVINPEQIPQAKNLSAEMENFHSKNFKESRLRTGNLSFSRSQTILLVSPFPNAEKAMAYRQKFLEEFTYQDLPEDAKKSSFVISIQNFQQLNKRKDIDEYKAFFKSFY
ncbi:gliding motility protein [Echinicola pacifica]|uniref:Gliding motility protein n=1 Tax=Echinicola pacifica TaxID=346377 RepID=A0A918PV43_9BACT|nr:gliding motility protein [Echinicola pacifica]